MFPHCSIAYNSYTAHIGFTAPVGFTDFSRALIVHIGITAWCGSVPMVIRWLCTSFRVYTCVVRSDIQFSFPSWASEYLRCEHAAVAAHLNSAAVPQPPGTAQPHSCHTSGAHSSQRLAVQSGAFRSFYHFFTSGRPYCTHQSPSNTSRHPRRLTQPHPMPLATYQSRSILLLFWEKHPLPTVHLGCSYLLPTLAQPLWHSIKPARPSLCFRFPWLQHMLNMCLPHFSSIFSIPFVQPPDTSFRLSLLLPTHSHAYRVTRHGVEDKG